MRLIEQIGSYAGLAAIPGVAVLSALYFSQARDVRRLREWAGRAPERAVEQAVGGRVAVQPQQAAAQGAEAAQAAKPATGAAGAQAVKPAAAVAAAAGAQAATAAGPSATPEGEAAKPGEEAAKTAGASTNGEAGDGVKPAATPAGDAAKPAALTPAAVAAAAAAKSPAKAGAGSAAAGSGGNATGTGTVTRAGPPAVGGTRPSTAGTPAARRPTPRLPSSPTSILGTGATARDRWYRRLAARLPAGRYIALIVAGALVLGGGAAFGISQLTDSGGDGGGGSSAGTPPAAKRDTSSTKPDGNVKSTPTINPSDVTVTVVNGTTIPNLARDTAAKLSQLGFQIGNKVTGTGSLAAAESVVEYRPGAEEEARYVAAKLHINQKQPADPDAVAQAGPAQVIVVLGADQAPGG